MRLKASRRELAGKLKKHVEEGSEEKYERREGRRRSRCKKSS